MIVWIFTVRLDDGSLSVAFTEAADIEAMQELKSINPELKTDEEKKESIEILHIVPQSSAFSQQQADLIWRLCSLQPDSMKQVNSSKYN